ncbi:MAG TPA: sugar ABC transporter permease [bacterium]|nr:sugar ABC transporter permease [bacterium]
MPGSVVRPPYGLMAPSVLFLAVVVWLPMLLAVYISLTRLNQYTITMWLQAPFVALHNYAQALDLRSPLAGPLYNSIRVSLAFSILTTLFITPIAVGGAILCNSQVWGRSALRAIMLLPYVIPTFVNAILWRLVFMNGGAANRILAGLHLGSQDTLWLIGSNAFWAMVTADVWAAWPFVYLMVLAALQTISGEVYDASKIDGADGVRGFRYVTLPIIWPTLALALVLSTIHHFNNFTLPFVMFGSSPPDSVNVLPLNVYISSFINLNFGLGAAESMMAMLIILVPAIFYLRATHVGESE